MLLEVKTMINRYPYPDLVSTDDDSYFFQALWGRIKFSIVFSCIVVAFAILLWNFQPWFKIEVKTVDKSSSTVVAK